MQHEFRASTSAWLLALALPLCGCSSAAPTMSYSQDSAASDSGRFELFTHEPLLYDAAQRAVQRIDTALGDSGIVLADSSAAARCEPFDPGCGLELSSQDEVYCLGNPDPALACTSFAGGGKALGIAMQAGLRGDELDNRLIHELFHVITLDRAEHSRDGLFMEYTLGDERISTGTLDSVCDHFACSRFEVEERVAADARVGSR